MSEIPKAYEPRSVEDKWYDFWVKQGCFTADPARVSPARAAYSLVIPPPNVTGVLHMGHVLNNTIQDILARKARMDGREVLWLPGTDHAGIATEGMVAKQVWREEKKSKHDLGREEFLKRVWAWKEKHGDIIIEQLKKLGCSCDWSRQRFTMDEHYVRCVQKVFVDLYRKGLIYRGKRMVNWCPATLTALSDEEVVMKEQKGSLYYFKVEVVDVVAAVYDRRPDGGDAQAAVTDRRYSDFKSSGIWLTLATTRPETIPGDTAVAVNPKDPRYAQLVGKHVVRPLPAELPREQKLIPIIGDEHVDFAFGTGVLKVTPAHDKADFEIGLRHELPAIDIMNPDATMNALAGEDLVGLDRFRARKVAMEKLKELGALEKEEPYTNNVGFSERADVPIEPRLSEQWFLKYPSVEKSRACVEQEDEKGGAPASGAAVSALADDLGRSTLPGAMGKFPHSSAADEASAAAGEGACAPQMHLHPQRWAKVYDHWMGNIQDWCISRQLWWGHQIPVWTPGPNARFLGGGTKEDSIDANKGPLYEADEFIREQQRGNPETIVVRTEPVGTPASSSFPFFREVCLAPGTEDIARALERMGWVQDPDVLDTWFSAWLWPFATMGWMCDKTQDSNNPTLQTFYPTTDLVTAPEIIFFWVARMIMAGYEYTGEMPFQNVYFTGIIRDKQGRKMSKSLGNSPDPLDLIARYGADAVRFGTMRSAPIGQDVLFDEQAVELGRNFCNKLWNACRFRQMQDPRAAGDSPADEASVSEGGSHMGRNFRQDAGSTFEGEINPKLLTSDDKWILLKLDKAIREITRAFAEYKFSDATATLYRFFWSEYCDWYVEASKAVLASKGRGNETRTPSGESQSLLTSSPASQEEARRANTLAVIDFVLGHTLRLFHPFLPFITEELWHGLGFNEDMPASQGGDTIMFAHWPRPFDDNFKEHYGLDESDERLADAKYELVSRGRHLRREFNIAANKKVKFIFKPNSPLSSHDAEVVKLLLNAEALEVNPAVKPDKGTPAALSELGELFLPLEGLVDVEAEKTRLRKELAKIEAEIAKVQSKLNNADFVQKAPPNVLDEHKKRLAEWQAKQQQVKTALDALA